MANKKILVVDDDPDFRALVGVLLQADGYAVISAQDGISGVAMAHRERPDLILLDLHMPAGDGQTILKRLKSLGPLANIPVIVASATPATRVRDDVMAGLAAGYLQKPIAGDDLLDAVRSCLGGQPSPESSPQASLECPHCHQAIVVTATRATPAQARTPARSR